jgi:glucose/arabinose dehydrogenase
MADHGVVRLRLLALGLAVVGGLAACGSTGSSSPKGGLVEIGAGLRGPAALKAAVYARGLRLAAAFAFDARGRLWVATSGASTHATDGVYLVARRGAKPIRVVSDVRGPLGLLWHRGTLYVASLGRVEAFGKLVGTHFAERRVVLRGPPGSGENNNLVLAPDGRILMGVSAPCDHCTPPTEYAGAIVSFRPDGSGLEPYATRIRAPFGLAFVPGTSRLLASMNQRDDLGAKTPGDWLAFVKRGQSWGFPGCFGQGGRACRGVPRPLAALDPHAAAGGVAVITGQLGPVVGRSAVVAEWQRSKVLRVSLPSGRVAPFLTGLHNPLPVAVTSRGTLLVGDWGTGVVYEISRR